MWMEWRETYRDFIYRGGFKVFELLIPNDIFNRINHLTISGEHKATTFCGYGTIKLATVRGMLLSNPQIKEMWGYNRKSKEVDCVFTKGGVLDTAGLTKTIKKGYKEVEYGKAPKDRFFKINADMMFAFMFRSDLMQRIGFYIYSYIFMRVQTNRGRFKELGYSWMAEDLGLDEKTIKKYVPTLNENKLINVISGREKPLFNGEGEFLMFSTNKYQVAQAIPGEFVGLQEPASYLKALTSNTNCLKVVSKPESFDFGDDDFLLGDDK